MQSIGRLFIAGILTVLLSEGLSQAQLNSLTPERLIQYTAKNPYDRFPDGRPRVPDHLLKELAELSSEDVMAVSTLNSWRGAPTVCFVGGFQVLNPRKKLVGRAFTLQLMPARPEIAQLDAELWLKRGNEVPLSHQSALDLLGPGDVIVIDAGGLVENGGIIGNNLAYYIWKKTGTGFVIDGAIRDLEEIAAYEMPGYFRAAVPPAIRGLMVTGINVPVRIGNATVLPGDVVLGDREGVNFIPPHLVQQILEEGRVTRLRDEWNRLKFDEGKYKSTDIYSRPRDPKLIEEQEQYLREKLGPAAYEEYQKRRKQKAP